MFFAAPEYIIVVMKAKAILESACTFIWLLGARVRRLLTASRLGA